MNTKELLLQEIEQVPEAILDEVLDFLRFLKTKNEREKLEMQTDLEDARAALKEAREQGTTSLADLKQELGLWNMTYSVEIAPAAKRQIKKLSKNIQQLIVERLEQLAEIPRPPGVLKMEGEESLYRIRVGDYRIIYEIQDRVLLIVIVKVGHRSSVYR